MSYDAVAKALYDYDAQDPEGELSFKEDQIIYIIDKEDDQWWKAKLKPLDDAPEDEEERVGLVPAVYVEEIPPIAHSRALYDYAATSPDELTIAPEDLLDVYEVGPEWNLVRLTSQGGKLGFVPANYTETVEEGDEGVMGGEVHEVDAAQPMSPGPALGGYASPSERVAASSGPKEKDGIETWSVSILDKKGRKKKGTLGVGNGSVFFASDTDKAPVQQFPITDLSSHTQPSSKHLLLTFSGQPEPMHFHCGTKDAAEAIGSKLDSSKRIASGGASAAVAPAERERANEVPRPQEVEEDEEEEAPAAAAPKAVRWAASPTSPTPAAAAPAAAGQQTAVALYDFDAAGDDELTVKEGETLVVLDSSNEDWWNVRNENGDVGVVPAQYVEFSNGSAASGAAGAQVASDEEEEDDSAAREAEDAAAREREAAIARAAAEAEAAERERAAAEQAKKERRERRRAEEERRRREEEAARRREAARQAAPPPEPPKLKQRPSANDVAAARNLPNPRGREQPIQPPTDPSAAGRSRPNPSRTRIWHDKTGQFRVEAELLGIGNGKLRLHKLNGVVIEVPLEKMSPEDVAFVKKHHSRRSTAPPRDADDDVPLARVAQAARPSAESQARATPPPQQSAPRGPPPAAARPKITFDWFEFFLNAGCDMDDCTRYARNFERDRIDETILPELDPGTLRSLGLREGDVIRVRKAIYARNPQLTPEQAAQIKKDEEYARQLQEAENTGKPPPPPPGGGGLFTGPDGKLANNTRRGRPERKGTVSSVDADSIAAASQQLARKPSPPLLPPSPPPAPPAPPAPEPAKAPAPLISGFDDDAWTPRPNSAKPATPTPAAQPAPSNQSPAGVTNQMSGVSISQPQAQPSSSNFDFLSQIGQNKTGGSSASGPSFSVSPAPQSYHAGLGMGNSTQAPMGQLLQAQQTGAFQQQQQQQQQQNQQQQQQNQQNGSRGPLAPVPANQGLLNPLIPTNTGFNGFVPTRQSPNPQMQQNNMMPQMTGYPGGMMPQQTGYGGYAQQQQPQQTGYMQPNMTGYQPQPTPVFSAFAAVPQQQAPQPTEQNKFQPANIFAKMKQGDIGKSPDAQPQTADKYDALRPQQTGMMMPLSTGYNGGMMPQQTGMMGQPGMMPQQTGFMMNGQQQQQPMYMQQTGFMPGMQQHQQQGYRY